MLRKRASDYAKLCCPHSSSKPRRSQPTQWLRNKLSVCGETLSSNVCTIRFGKVSRHNLREMYSYGDVMICVTLLNFCTPFENSTCIVQCPKRSSRSRLHTNPMLFKLLLVARFVRETCNPGYTIGVCSAYIPTLAAKRLRARLHFFTFTFCVCMCAVWCSPRSSLVDANILHIYLAHPGS